MATIHELRPARRYQRPIWELFDDDGSLIGWIREHMIGRSSVVFYKAIGIHPESGQHVTLESSADREERIARILDFRSDPEKYRGVHWHNLRPESHPAVAGCEPRDGLD